ncbi:hypothetical protein BDZ89DRAFT_1064218 [Hymenopellis radicata]|nr:hypothetical protein BDZ89DRAFT_1064218 [Hymenopellis radicata]
MDDDAKTTLDLVRASPDGIGRYKRYLGLRPDVAACFDETKRLEWVNLKQYRAFLNDSASSQTGGALPSSRPKIDCSQTPTLTIPGNP